MTNHNTTDSTKRADNIWARREKSTPAVNTKRSAALKKKALTKKDVEHTIVAIGVSPMKAAPDQELSAANFQSKNVCM